MWCFIASPEEVNAPGNTGEELKTEHRTMHKAMVSEEESHGVITFGQWTRTLRPKYNFIVAEDYCTALLYILFYCRPKYFFAYF